MPGNRVKEAMNARIWVMNQKVVADFFNKEKLNKKTFYTAIQDADIAFTKSIRRGRHKVYDLTLTNAKDQEIHCLARMTDESFVVEFVPFVASVKALQKQKEKPLAASILYVPGNKHLVYSDQRPALQEHLKALGIRNDDQLQKQLYSGTFSPARSRLNEQPRPLHVFRFTPSAGSKDSVTATCIWYKDKVKVADLKAATKDF